MTAVICHHGTVGGGHYTSFAKHEFNGGWFEYDDQLVTAVTEDTVQNCEAYVLFYRKSNPKMAGIRSEAMQLADWCSAEPTTSYIRFFVSKQWLSKLNTFAEPGPIDNWALLCQHGALPPNKAPIKTQLFVALPQPLWEYLYRKFGGGPACNHLYECDICRRAAESLLQRQNDELDDFQKYKDETTSTIYAISMAWLRQWQIFVGGGGTADDDPGPINNTAIAGHAPETAGIAIRSVRSGSDYAQINSSLWKFFYTVYGGGPVIMLRGNGEELKEIKKKEPIEKMDIVEDIQQIDTKLVLPEQDVSTAKKASETDATEIVQSVATISSDVPQKTKKVIKNVSFEDDAELNENSSIASSTQSTETVSGGSVGSAPIYKRIKQHHHSKSAEIVSKRDKRHRGGITSNGLFGPEGKLIIFNIINFQINIFFFFVFK